MGKTVIRIIKIVLYSIALLAMLASLTVLVPASTPLAIAEENSAEICAAWEG